MRARSAPRSALVLVAASAAALAPLIAHVSAEAAPGSGTPSAAAKRQATPPNVAYPVDPGASPVDARNYRPGRYNGTDLVAPCGTAVRAATPGTVRIKTGVSWAGGKLVQVVTSEKKIVTYYAFMKDISVSSGQILQAGQPIGTVGDAGSADRCELHFQVWSRNLTRSSDPTAWLDKYVGKKVPSSTIFGNTGFNLSTYNMLGASHTTATGDARKKYPAWDVRLPRSIKAIDAAKSDVIGLQEFQKNQYAGFRKQVGTRYSLYPPSTSYDTENSLAWRTSAFTLVQANLAKITYFNGSTRKMPYVLLRQKSTGYTAWFINVHNPANTAKYKKQEKYRAAAIAEERALVVKLRGTGRPVFLTGDLNDREKAFCPLSAGKLMLSADSIASTTCQPPTKPWIDWIMAAGQARFSSYLRDWSVRDVQKASDHPLITARVHIAS